MTTSDEKYPLSKLTLLYTQIPQTEFQALVESIREGGLRRPITLWRGQIIDGRHRYEACLQAGVEPHFVELPDDADAFQYVLDENSARRHMTDSQRAVAAHRTWEEAASGWAGLGLMDGESANLHSLTLQQAADLFHVSRRLVVHAGRIFGRDTRAVQELRQAADQGAVAVSDASRVVDQPPEIQLAALEMVRGGRSKTAARAAEMVLQETREPQPDEGPGAGLPEQPPGSVTLHCSALGDLHRLVERESVDAIITNPPTSKESLAKLPDLAAFAAHSLNPGGAMVVLASAEHLPAVLENLHHPELLWVCELDLIFDGSWARLREKHHLELLRRPLLVYGKNQFRLNGGNDLVRVPRTEEAPTQARQLIAGMTLIVERFTQHGQVVCDPITMGRNTVAFAALGAGRRFIGAGEDQTAMDSIRHWLDGAGISDTSSVINDN